MKKAATSVARLLPHAPIAGTPIPCLSTGASVAGSAIVSKRELFYRQGRVWCAVLLLVQPVDEGAHAEEGSPKGQRKQDLQNQLDNVVPADGFRVLKPGQQRQHSQKLEHKEDANDSSKDTKQTEHDNFFGDAECESNPT